MVRINRRFTSLLLAALLLSACQPPQRLVFSRCGGFSLSGGSFNCRTPKWICTLLASLRIEWRVASWLA